MVKDGDTVTRYGLNVAVRRYQLANWIGGQGDYNFFGDNEGGRTAPMTKVTFGEDGTLRNFLTEWQKVIATEGRRFAAAARRARSRWASPGMRNPCWGRAPSAS